MIRSWPREEQEDGQFVLLDAPCELLVERAALPEEARRRAAQTQRIGAQLLEVLGCRCEHFGLDGGRVAPTGPERLAQEDSQLVHRPEVDERRDARRDQDHGVGVLGVFERVDHRELAAPREAHEPDVLVAFAQRLDEAVDVGDQGLPAIDVTRREAAVLAVDAAAAPIEAIDVVAASAQTVGRSLEPAAVALDPVQVDDRAARIGAAVSDEAEARMDFLGARRRGILGRVVLDGSRVGIEVGTGGRAARERRDDEEGRDAAVQLFESASVSPHVHAATPDRTLRVPRRCHSAHHSSAAFREDSPLQASRPLVVVFLLAAACRSPVLKPDALASDVLERSPLPAEFVTSGAKDELELRAAPGWLADVRPLEAPTFAGLRADDGGTTYVLVLECDPEADRLTALPLADGESPLDALADDARRAELAATLERFAAGDRPRGTIEASIAETIARRRFAPPIPEPTRIFGAAANYPSHLINDFQAKWTPEAREELQASRPRVFLKHPPVAPEGYQSAAELGFRGVVGPFDGIRHPAQIPLPLGKDGEPVPVELRLDYEVEIGVVFSRELTWLDVATASDQEIREAVAGLVLASDAKSRNPPAAVRILGRGGEPSLGYEPYRPEHDHLEERMGYWGPNICTWWSYAASFGDFSALGPFFVALPEKGPLQARAMLSARSYASTEERGIEPPKGRVPDVLYVRQCSETTLDRSAADTLVWSVPAIVRSILAPDSVIPFPGGEARISPGDVLCLGTPGGNGHHGSEPACVRALDAVLVRARRLARQVLRQGRDAVPAPGGPRVLLGRGSRLPAP